MSQRLQKLLLLNPPAPEPVFRDCYCSGRTKGPFFVHPLDLQMQSGFFSRGDFQVEFLDAIFEGLTSGEALKLIVVKAPDFIFALVGEEVLETDAAFFRKLKSALPKARLFLSGDIARFNPQRTFEEIPEAEGFLMDFSSPSLSHYLIEGRLSDGMLLRTSQNLRPAPLHGTFSSPLPLACVVKKYPYRLPFFRVTPYYSMATIFGCSFSCDYCNTHQLGDRVRDPDECIDELRFASRLGYKSIYFRDATFFSDRHHALLFIEGWRRAGLTFDWMCFTRPDLIDEEIAGAAAESGCCLMMLGVESPDEVCLRGLSRHIPDGAAEKAFRILRRKRIPTAAGIIAGLHSRGADANPDFDVKEYQKQLTAFLCRLDPDYVAINVYSARPGANPDHPFLNALGKQKPEYQRLAGTISRNFYLRPKSLLRAMSHVRSIDQLALQARSGLSLLFS